MSDFMNRNIKWKVSAAIGRLIESYSKMTVSFPDQSSQNPQDAQNSQSPTTRGQKLEEVMRQIRARWGETIENKYYTQLYERLTPTEPLNPIEQGLRQAQVVDTFIDEMLHHLEVDRP